MRLPQIVMQVQLGSSLCGLISHTTLVYVTSLRRSQRISLYEITEKVLVPVTRGTKLEGYLTMP